MRIRVLLAAAAVALTAVQLAWSSGAAFSSCGTVSGGGAKWSVIATHVSCQVAKPLVQTLAAEPHPSIHTRLGRHQGLNCTELAGGNKREISCLSKDATRTVFGVSPPRK
jgi:hypothetical protein